MIEVILKADTLTVEVSKLSQSKSKLFAFFYYFPLLLSLSLSISLSFSSRLISISKRIISATWTARANKKIPPNCISCTDWHKVNYIERDKEGIGVGKMLFRTLVAMLGNVIVNTKPDIGSTSIVFSY